MSRSSRTGGRRHPAPASAVFITLILLSMAPAWADETFSVLPLLREQRRDAEELERQQRLRQLTAPTAISAPFEATASKSVSDQCWPVSAVRLAGNTLISAEALNRVLDPLLRPWVERTQVLLAQRSPLMLCVTFAQLQRGRRLGLEDCFRMERTMMEYSFAYGDTMEGIRALLIDKDRAPRWRHRAVAEVRREEVEAFFA